MNEPADVPVVVDPEAAARVAELGIQAKLARHRNQANYDLRPLALVANAIGAQDSIGDATAALTLLDAIEADPVRRTAAIASLPP